MVCRLSKYVVTLLLALSLGAVAFGQTLSGTTLTVSGAEQSSGGVWDSGSVTVTVNGYTRTYSGLSGYGRYSDVGSVASLIAEHLSTDTAAPVWAKSVGPVITFVGRAGQPVTASASTAYDTAHFGGPSFTFTSGSTTVTPTPFLSLHCTRSTMGTSDKANCVASIEGTSTLYGAHAATNSMAFTVNSASWTSTPVGTDGTATATGFAEGAAGTYSIRADYPGDSYYSAMHATATITVGSTPSSMNVYSYFITGSGGSGYDPAGNITAYADSVNGQWTLGYDSLNRVQAASSSPAIKPYTPYLCWSYDSFGNRSQQYFGSSAFSGGGTTACSGGGSTVATQDQYYSSNNQLTRDTTISTSFSYDASGNMTSDGSGGHQYAYDDEGRVCAMSTGISPTYYWGYLYDAEGHRVAKGSISSLDCSLVNGDSFAVREYYVIGPDGAPMTVLDGSGNWKHTDVPAGPGTMAVYDGDGLHFRLSDWLGSHRVQTDYQGATPVEDTYQSLPFGELLGSSAGATQKHFTGKEHDDESGLDYFGARYYWSGSGRWMSADWSAKPEAVPYSVLGDPQSLNLYSYVRNHPVNQADPDGHCCWEAMKTSFKETTNAVATSEFPLLNAISAYSNAKSGRYVSATLDIAAMIPMEGAGAKALQLTSEAGLLEKAAGQAGRFSEMKKIADAGEGLVAHHIPQAALKFTSRTEGGALVMTRGEHALTRTFSGRGAQTVIGDAGKSARQVLAQDIKDVRSIAGSKYNQGLLDLTKYYKENFPNLMSK